MIYFKSIRYKNLMMTGNYWIELPLNEARMMLITGENGAGKSTVSEAICFALYGRPYRDINKPQLVNSVTMRNMLVEIEFTNGKKDYKVKRGAKPNVFEIYEDDVMLPITSDLLSYQEYFETEILKVPYKSFCQIVLLGTAVFMPFMKLPTNQRREIVEDLLDIKVFTTMNQLLKGQVAENKALLDRLDREIDLTENTIGLIKKHKEALALNRDELISQLQDQIRNCKEENEALEATIPPNEERLAAHDIRSKGNKKLQKKLSDLSSLKTQLEIKLQKQQAEAAFYERQQTCQVCTQEISSETKERLVGHAKAEANALIDAIRTLDTKQSEIRAEILAGEGEIHSLGDPVSDLNTARAKIAANKKICRDLDKRIGQLRAAGSDQREVEGDLDSHELELDRLRTERVNAQEERETLQIAGTLLKDGGIKTKIVQQYMPLINSRINHYLDALELPILFELDDSFSEVIKSRHRSGFKYNSFSQGQKARIDLAVLLTWRDVAAARQTSELNLVLLDEIVDGSLSESGIELTLNLLSNYGEENKANIIMISPKFAQFERFDKVVEFFDDNGMSRIVEN